MQELEEIKARAEAANEGPWFAVRYYVGSGEDQGDPDAEIATTGYKPDAEFIAHARTEVPKLVTALARILSETEQQPVAHERIFQIIAEALA
jgi:hypothetical protein